MNLFISSLQTDPAYFFAVVITVVISITLHELAHGYAAIKLGDDTPIYSGHMTLNPLVHMGGFSLILLAIAGIAFGAMPVDRTRLRGKYGEAIMAAAGPATNLLLAALTLGALVIWERVDHTPYSQWSPVMANGKYLLLVFGITNVILMLFNLIPLPPLDGFWIASNLSSAYRRMLGNDTIRGVMNALFLVAFFVAGAYISDFARDYTLRLSTKLSGRPGYHYIIILTRTTITHPERAKDFDLLNQLGIDLRTDGSELDQPE